MTAMTMTGPYRNRMLAKLKEKFTPARLILEDESQKHIGHAENSGEGETHFRSVSYILSLSSS